ncbi:unnamed protein product [Leptidea sinapis]|uniref:Uncharacterized protein n=1 Tax=Leptidea sinapis TaxID=189913 RepID=A0A5E4QJH9_9NEOP|nr:unnamed protein product [Leptidea sinapis]
MMDIKDIIKWFIPCFHVLLWCARKISARLTVVCLFLILCPTYEAKVLSDTNVAISKSNTKSLDNFSANKVNFTGQSDEPRGDTSIGRTFGRPFKRMIQALVPLAFQMGAASTWAVIAAMVGIKTLAVTLLILKLLLLAAAAKFGTLFASKHHSHGWESPTPHQKEIHLHIHNGQHGEEHIPISPWSREGVQASNPSETKHVNVGFDPYGGPQTISTPYGHYMKIDPAVQPH